MVGVSTACFYPCDTLVSLQKLQQVGIQHVEIFLNSFCELEQPYIDSLRNALQQFDTKATSLHPFSSGFETFFFASHYGTRLHDGIELYTKYFKACQQLSINRLVFHGDYLHTDFPFEQHCQNYLELRNVAKHYGVNLCYENVVRNKCGFAENIYKLRQYTNDDVNFVFDYKQARRANVPIDKMIKAMENKISLVHISDYNTQSDCILPGNGETNYIDLFSQLKKANFNNDIIIELYENNFQTAQQLYQSACMLKAVYENEDGAQQ